MLPGDIPSLADIEQWLPTFGGNPEWAGFLHGLPWHIIRPTVQIAVASHNHPAVALGVASLYSGDPEVKRVAHEHLTRHDPGTSTPPPNRAARRAAARRRR